ncbi:hypothetical protein JCM19233_891 [Vibrio astriarenae]|nr:hypothetical protein JCM19233_891 [Vibrio sp. C7]
MSLKAWHLAAYLLMALGIVGCKSEQEDMFSRYLDRLSNVLDDEARPLPQSYPSSLPEVRELHRAPTRITLGLLDSYSLRQCGLFQLVADNNSIMGKVADSFRQYDYQVSFIQTVEQCITHEDISDDVSAALQQALEIKKNEVNAVYLSNLVWTSTAMRTQLGDNRWFSDADAHHSAVVVDALAAIDDNFNEAAAHQWQVLRHLQSEQETLEKQPILGRLLYSLHNTANYIEHINHFISARFPNVKCGENRDNTQYRYLTNVLKQQYIENIQQYTAELNQMYYQISPHISTLRNGTLAHHYNLDEHYGRFQSANLEHVELWKQLSERCGSLTQ